MTQEEQQEYELLLHFFKVLSDSNRLKLLGLLATKAYSVDELATLLKLKAPVAQSSQGLL